MSHDVHLYDEDGRLFDSLRGRGSLVAKMSEYMDEEGGSWGSIEHYLQEQARSSWSLGSAAVKGYLSTIMNFDESTVYWGGEGMNRARALDLLDRAYTRAGGKNKLETTWAAFHAFNYNLVQNVDLPNNDRAGGFIRIIRTEEKKIMYRYGMKHGENLAMPRGLLESGSLINVVSVFGGEITVQQVPHSRVWATYLYSREPGDDRASLASNAENEIVFMPNGIRFDYVDDLP